MNSKVSIVTSPNNAKTDQKTFKYALLVIALWFLLLLLLYPLGLTANEENYFLLAHSRVSPELYSQFSAAVDHSNARFLIEYLLGALINLMGFEYAHIFSHFLMLTVYSISIGLFFYALELPILESLAVICLFSLFGEELYGGEWLFHGVEGKTFAYAAVFSALGLFFSGRWIISILFFVLATYFHFLVGGFWMLFFLVLMMIHSFDKLKILKSLILYCALVTPLLLILLVDQYSPTSIQSNADPNFIYANRAAHHIAPFLRSEIIQSWKPAILATFALFISFYFLRKYDNDKKLLVFGFYLLGYMLLALVVTYFDRNTYLLGKFYLFRPSSLVLFIVLTSLVVALPNRLHKRLQILLNVAISAIVFYFIASKSISLGATILADRNPDKEAVQSQLIDAVQLHSEKSDIVLIEPYKETEQPYVGLHRKLERPTLVSWRFDPTNPGDLVRWDQLIKFRKSLFDAGCIEKLAYPIRFLLIFNRPVLDKMKTCGPVVWSDKSSYLIQVDANWTDPGTADNSES